MEEYIHAHIHAFNVRALESRAEIIRIFKEFRDVLDASEDKALIDFDRAHKLKTDAMTATCDQISTRMKSVDISVYDLSHDFPSPTVPTFNPAGMNILRETIQAGKSWDFIHLEPDSDMDALALITARAQCSLLTDMHQFITQAKEELGRTAFSNHVGAPSFQNQCVATIPVEIENIQTVTDIAVSCDASLVAVLSIGTSVKPSIFVFSICTGDIITSFGHDGGAPAQFKSPTSLCFVPGTSNLMVADYGNCRLQEVTSTGQHVRFVDNLFENKYCCVDANTNVIVATTKKVPGIWVFNYHTGAYVKTLADHPGNTPVAIKLTPDGTCVATVDAYMPIINFLSVETGLALKVFSFSPSKLHNIHFVNSDQFVVKAFRDGHWQTSLCSHLYSYQRHDKHPSLLSTLDAQHLASVGNSLCVYRQDRKEICLFV